MKRFISSVIVLLFVSFGALAQGFDPMAPLANDPDIRFGKLDNGLTYYLKHNALPAQRADFYLVTNVGAIQETPEQDGLAHFLEHMCLNGTKNLPGKQMLEYFASVGVEFGRNINAGTGVEQTSYMLTEVPTIRKGIVDTALLILHDYSHFVTNATEEIEAERGVIVEEWRTRRTSDWRMHEKELPYLYGNSKYGSCTLIGSKQNLETFEPHHLVDFYKTWYRPDLQAVIISGDIDVDAIEAQLKELFADVPAAENPQPKVMPTVENNEEPVVGVITDPEARTTSINVYVKADPIPMEYRQFGIYYMNQLVTGVLYDMFNERLNDIAMQAGAPFLRAYGRYGNWVRTKDAAQYSIIARDGEGIKAFDAVAKEIEKVRRFGFTTAEFERAKANTLRYYEQAVDKASTRRNSDFVYPCMVHFLLGEPYMTPAAEQEVAKNIFSLLNVQVLNQAAAQLFAIGKNTVVIYKSVEKEGLAHPAADEFKAVIAALPAAEIAAPVEEVANEAFIENPDALKGSKIKSEAQGPFGAQVWTLKNGIKIYALPTDYKKDEVIFGIENEGGISTVPTEDIASMEDNIRSILENYAGISKFPSTQVQKMLTGKKVSVYRSAEELYQGVSGSCSTKDIETFFQLVYLHYAQPRFEEGELQAGLDYIKNLIPNLEKMPNFQFQKETLDYLYQHNPRKVFISSELLAKFNFEAFSRNMKALWSNAAGSVAIIVGDFDPAQVKELAQKYLGSLPVGKKAPKYVDHNYQIIPGVNDHPFEVAMETPKVTADIYYSGDMAYTLQNRVRMNAFEYILDLIYTEEIREKEGGTYGVSSICRLVAAPKQKFTVQVAFDTEFEKSQKLIKMAKDLFEKVAAEGPTQEQLNKAKENALKNVSENRISNNYWMGRLESFVKYNVDFDTDYEEAVKALTVDSIKDLAKEIIAAGNRCDLVMNPAK